MHQRWNIWYKFGSLKNTGAITGARTTQNSNAVSFLAQLRHLRTFHLAHPFSQVSHAPTAPVRTRPVHDVTRPLFVTLSPVTRP